MSSIITLLSLFASVFIVAALIIGWMFTKYNVSSRASVIAEGKDDYESTIPTSEIAGISDADRILIENYFNTLRHHNEPNSLRGRLSRAGFFSKEAVVVYHIVRFSIAFFLFVSVYSILQFVVAVNNYGIVILASLLVPAASFVIINIVLEHFGDKNVTYYRKIFPDFMDMLIVCLDAGLSMEAAIDRVAREFLESHKDFGVNLMVMIMEIRGGRRLREALSNLGARIHIDEAKSVATLLRQSEEMGTGVTQTLRVYANEMRQRRQLRAEEKANALPVKMLFPLAVFLFPMSLLIVIVPIMLKILALFQSMGPNH